MGMVFLTASLLHHVFPIKSFISRIFSHIFFIKCLTSHILPYMCPIKSFIHRFSSRIFSIPYFTDSILRYAFFLNLLFLESIFWIILCFIQKSGMLVAK